MRSFLGDIPAEDSDDCRLLLAAARQEAQGQAVGLPVAAYGWRVAGPGEKNRSYLLIFRSDIFFTSHLVILTDPGELGCSGRRQLQEFFLSGQHFRGPMLRPGRVPDLGGFRRLL